MGIRIKLLLCLVAVLVPIATAGSFTLHVFQTRLAARIEAELAGSLRLEAARITEVLEDYRHDAVSLAAGQHVRAFVGGLDAHRTGELGKDVRIGGIDGFPVIEPEASRPLRPLALALQRKAAVVGTEAIELRLVDRTGRPLGESAGFGWTPTDGGLVERAMTRAVPLFGDAFLRGDGQRRLGIVAPVHGADRRVVGALLIEARLGRVVDLLARREGLGESSEAHIAQRLPNGDARFITPLRFDQDAAFSRRVSGERRVPIVEALEAPVPRVLHAPDYRGVDSLLAVATLAETGWGLVVKIDASEAFAPLVAARHAALLGALASLAAILAGWAWCLHPIVRRLRRTAVAAQRLTEGDLGWRVEDASGDEIGDVARGLDRLAGELEADRGKRNVAEERLRHHALHDELTGLHNRKHANAVIAALGGRAECRAAIAFLDLDGFKDVNDVYGHAAGDEVLAAIAGRLRHVVDAGATLARWGGDEFVVILPDGDGRAAEAVAGRIRRLFEEPVVSGYGTHRLDCSIGLATADAGHSLEDAMSAADASMYEQKHRRRRERSIETVTLRTVEGALRENRIEVWYQPIVGLPAPGRMRLQGAEALVRLRTRAGAIVGPEDFLGEVRDHALGRELDRRVMTRSLEALARWRRAGVVSPAFRLAINLSGESLRSDDFVDAVVGELARLGIPAEHLVVELSEESGDIDRGVLGRLRALGVALALDDVGLHRSNLDRLIGLCPDIAKIDRQWVDDDVVLPRLIDICRQLGMQIVAEGVETVEQLERLGALGVTRFQGHLFAQAARGVQFVSAWGTTGMLEPGVDEDHRLRLVG